MSTKPEFNYVTFINAPREKVWEALTKPEFTEKYWHKSRMESDWKEGGNYTFYNSEGKKVLYGKILKVDRPNELVYQFQAPWNDEVKDEDSTVQFLFEDADGLTKLSVRHYNFEAGSKLFGLISQGWPEVLSGLKTLLETGKTLPIAGN